MWDLSRDSLRAMYGSEGGHQGSSNQSPASSSSSYAYGRDLNRPGVRLPAFTGSRCVCQSNLSLQQTATVFSSKKRMMIKNFVDTLALSVNHDELSSSLWQIIRQIILLPVLTKKLKDTFNRALILNSYCMTQSKGYTQYIESCLMVKTHILLFKANSQYLSSR